MEVEKILLEEQSLDPEDWGELRRLGHQMVDDMLRHLETVRERPIWQPPTHAAENLKTPLPVEPTPLEDVYAEFQQNILPYPMGNIHPRFWGWVIGTGSPGGVLAEMLAATMNPNCGGGDHAANYVEAQVLDWFKEMFGYSSEASGLLVSGGSMANLLGLAVARNTCAGFDIRKAGARASKGQLLVYCSTETHNSVQKSMEMLGLGSDSLRKIPVDADFRIVSAKLKEAICRDKEEGHRPFCVIGTAGTVNTGAIDDLTDLADICEAHDLWFHVDGAFGAIAAILPEFKEQLAGMDRADSLAFDLHKWLYVPFEAGCILIKDPKIHREAFAVIPDYLMHHERGIAGGPYYFSNLGIELSRGFKSLKAWFMLKEHGIRKYEVLVRQNIAQAAYLADLVNEQPELELLAPVPLNIVCYRFVAEGVAPEKLDELNKEILMELHERAIAAPSFTVIDGKYAIRVAITNHRSRKEDFEALVEATVTLGRELAPQFVVSHDTQNLTG